MFFLNDVNCPVFDLYYRYLDLIRFIIDLNEIFYFPWFGYKM